MKGIILAGEIKFCLKPRWRARAFLFAIGLAIIWAIVETLRMGAAATLGESRELNDLRLALALDPVNPELYHRVGLTFAYSPDDLNPGQATKYLRRAAELSPSEARYWADLASACESVDDRACSDQGFQRALSLNPMSPRLYWTAANHYLRTNRSAVALMYFRRLLELNPRYSRSTFALCLKALHDPAVVYEGVLLPARDIKLKLNYIDYLCGHGEPDYAFHRWSQDISTASTFAYSRAKPYLNCLFERGRLGEAGQVWRDLERLRIVPKSASGDDQNLVFNGGFETDPLNGAFDWRSKDEAYVSVDFADPEAFRGLRCLRLDFTVSRNDEHEPISELVSVLPNQGYVFTAYVRSDDITSDSGPRLRIRDRDCPACLDISSETTVGTTSWHPVSFVFSSGPRARTLQVSVWRPRSRKYPTEISGRFWLDSVSLRAEVSAIGAELQSSSRASSSLVRSR